MNSKTLLNTTFIISNYLPYVHSKWAETLTDKRGRGLEHPVIAARSSPWRCLDSSRPRQTVDRAARFASSPSDAFVCGR